MTVKNNLNVCSRMWTDTNINFQTKTMRHCCKQTPYSVSIDELDQLSHNVFEQHPSNVKDRNTSLNENKLPPSCKWCIDTAPHNMKKIWNIWSEDWITENKDSLYDGSYVSYIDLDLGKSCDLACVYCGPWSSTTWAKELGQPANAMIDDEWKSKTLDKLANYISHIDSSTPLTINILGGEPTLIVETYHIISYIAKHCSHFDHKPMLMITTNLNCKPAQLKKLLNTIEETKDVFTWVISISIEDINERAEAVRYHLNFKKFEDNVKLIKDKADKIYLTATLSLLSFPNFDEFINWSFNILGKENYTTTWDYTLNHVQEGYTDLAYCSAKYVDIDNIKQTYLDNIYNSNNVNQSKVDAFITHMDNMFTRCGSKQVDSAFTHYWETLSTRRSIDYFSFYPLDKILCSSQGN